MMTPALLVAVLSLTFGSAYGFLDGDMPYYSEDAWPDYRPDGPPAESQIIRLDLTERTGAELRRYVVTGTGGLPPGTPGNVMHSLDTGNGFVSIGVFSEETGNSLRAMGYSVMEDIELDFHEQHPDATGLAAIVRSEGTRAAGYTGSGVTVGIVDTGVDFSSPDMRHAVARDGLGRPIMLDAESRGLVLTNATFVANLDRHNVVRNHTGDLPENATSAVYSTKRGVFLDMSQGGGGTVIQVYNSLYPSFGDSPVLNGTISRDMRIGLDDRNYIVSKSGVYHLGVLYQSASAGLASRIQVVPVLVVDSEEAGVYDTIIADMSTSWADYASIGATADTRSSLEFDFDFTDETPIRIGGGDEFLVYDSDGDGRDDYSAGMVGAQMLDIYGVTDPEAPEAEELHDILESGILPPLDPDGNFIGVMSDYIRHGSASASTIASAGQDEYDVYGDGTMYSLEGVAPEARILPIRSLFLGSTLYGWMWAAGFEYEDGSWRYGGPPRADIISNSWGIPHFPLLEAPPGMDTVSGMMSALSVPHFADPDYPGVVMFSSMGNSGPGYGTLSSPASSPFGISVGATTNNVFVGYGGFAGQPRFGNTTEHRNHIVDFSSRGPDITGVPKPDIMALGAYGFVPAPPVTRIPADDAEPQSGSFALYGGTSMASPMAAGAAALIVEALQEDGSGYDPFLIKNIMMSTATDLYSDPLAQGAGLVNVGDALRYIRAQPGSFLVHNDATYRNVLDVLESPVASFNSTDLGLEEIALPSRPYPSTPWFAGRLEPGQRSIATFTVENPSGVPLELSVRSQAMGLTDYSQYRGDTVPYETDTVHTGPDAFVPNYIRLSDVRSFETLSDYLETPPPMPDAEMLILTVDFDFDDFMQSRDGLYADDMQIASLYLYDWNDRNADGGISSDELSMVSRAGSWGTVQELRVSDPNSLFEHEPVVGVYPVPIRYSYWTGEREDNVTSIGYTLSAGYYARGDWGTAWITDREVTVPARGSAEISAVIFVPDGTPTGVHQGVISFEGGHKAVHVPVSFIVVEPVGVSNVILRTQGAEVDGVLYGNGYVKGSSDMLANYPSGDWRLYYYDIQDERIDSASFRIEWEDGESSLSVFAVDPGGMIVQSNVPAGVFAELAGWPSNDWLGDTPFGGGGFYPVSGPDDPSTFLHVPINQTGIHALMVHSTLFGGNRTSEPISILASFADLDT